MGWDLGTSVSFEMETGTQNMFRIKDGDDETAWLIGGTTWDKNHDVVEFQETDVSQSQIHLLVLGPAVVARDNENEMFFSHVVLRERQICCSFGTWLFPDSMGDAFTPCRKNSLQM